MAFFKRRPPFQRLIWCRELSLWIHRHQMLMQYGISKIFVPTGEHPFPIIAHRDSVSNCVDILGLWVVISMTNSTIPPRSCNVQRFFRDTPIMLFCDYPGQVILNCSFELVFGAVSNV